MIYLDKQKKNYPRRPHVGSDMIWNILGLSALLVHLKQAKRSWVLLELIRSSPSVTQAIQRSHLLEVTWSGKFSDCRHFLFTLDKQKGAGSCKNTYAPYTQSTNKSMHLSCSPVDLIDLLELWLTMTSWTSETNSADITITDRLECLSCTPTKELNLISDVNPKNLAIFWLTTSVRSTTYLFISFFCRVNDFSKPEEERMLKFGTCRVTWR